MSTQAGREEIRSELRRHAGREEIRSELRRQAERK